MSGVWLAWHDQKIAGLVALPKFRGLDCLSNNYYLLRRNTIFYLGALNYIPVLEIKSTAPKTMNRNFILLFQIGFIAANSNEHPSMKLNTFLKSKYSEDIFL